VVLVVESSEKKQKTMMRVSQKTKLTGYTCTSVVKSYFFVK
jgi:hypothetical protein